MARWSKKKMVVSFGLRCCSQWLESFNLSGFRFAVINGLSIAAGNGLSYCKS